MRTRSALLFSITVALASGATSVSAKYTEEWVSSSAIAREPSAKGKTHVKSAATKTSSKHHKNAKADDDPIAAFAHESRRK